MEREDIESEILNLETQIRILKSKLEEIPPRIPNECIKIENITTQTHSMLRINCIQFYGEYKDWVYILNDDLTLKCKFFPIGTKIIRPLPFKKD